MATKAPPKRTGFKDAKTHSSDNKRVDDIVEVHKPGAKFAKYRFLDVHQVVTVWIEKKVKDKATGKRKKINFPIQPPDEETQAELVKFYGDKARASLDTYCNVIVRSDQKKQQQAEQDGEWLEKGEGYSPVKVIRLPLGVTSKLVRMMNDLNDGYDLTDPKKGADVALSYDKGRGAAAMYELNYDKKTPLTKRESAYATWNLEKLSMPSSRADLAKRLLEEGYDGILLDDLQPNMPSKASKASQKASTVSKKGKGKAKGKAKKRPKSAYSDPDSDEIPF